MNVHRSVRNTCCTNRLQPSVPCAPVSITAGDVGASSPGLQGSAPAGLQGPGLQGSAPVSTHKATRVFSITRPCLLACLLAAQACRA
eukprot:1159084-Pelagomonas_calceolata.AAC.3